MRRETARRVVGIERGELDMGRVAAGENLGHDLSLLRADDDAVSNMAGRGRRNDDDVAVPIERHHGIT